MAKMKKDTVNNTINIKSLTVQHHNNYTKIRSTVKSHLIILVMFIIALSIFSIKYKETCDILDARYEYLHSPYKDDPLYEPPFEYLAYIDISQQELEDKKQLYMIGIIITCLVGVLLVIFEYNKYNRNLRDYK